ncbi:MAG: RcnB family protein [Caulobacter sp.]|jgi:Ni/Co efflux regulator RcnB|nr:RcnB family protein [Caulobacter sp.]
MKRTLTVSVAMLMLAGGAGAAAAQAHQHDRHGNARDQIYENVRRDQARRDARRDLREHRLWVKGQRLDARYLDRAYYVGDWKRHGLRAPPRGYQWRKIDDQFVLAAVATGLIASVIITAP